MRLHDAIRSVCGQTCADWQLVVCDNSAPGDTRSAEVVGQFNDPRIAYIRTPGTLSMPDNWEHAWQAAAGEYLIVLTDRSVLRRDALATVHAEIAATGAFVLSWYADRFGGDESGRRFVRRPSTGERRTVDSRGLLAAFLRGDCGGRDLPKMLNACCHRTLLEQLRSTGIGRAFPPVCPDYTSAYLLLASTDTIMQIDESLYVSCGAGNSAAFQQRAPLAQQFVGDLNLRWIDLVDRMPAPAPFTPAVLLNDFLRLQAALPGWFEGLSVDRVHYYLSCLAKHSNVVQRGGGFPDDLEMLLLALDRESDDVQDAVRRHPAFRRAIVAQPFARTRRRPDAGAADSDGAGTEFASVFDALAWSESQPREQATATPRERPRVTPNAPPWWKNPVAS